MTAAPAVVPLRPRLDPVRSGWSHNAFHERLGAEVFGQGPDQRRSKARPVLRHGLSRAEPIRPALNTLGPNRTQEAGRPTSSTSITVTPGTVVTSATEIDDDVLNDLALPEMEVDANAVGLREIARLATSALLG